MTAWSSRSSRWLTGRRDGGSAAAAVVVLCGVCVVMLLSVALVTAAAVGRARAAAAADAAALAGAVVNSQGDGAPCAAASRLAARHGAALTRCDVSAESVLVEVSLPLAGRGVELPWPARATARAGSLP